MITWHTPIPIPTTTIYDPRTRPTHHALTTALHHHATIEGDLQFQATNRDVMKAMHLNTEESFRRYRREMRDFGHVTYWTPTGEITEYLLPYDPNVIHVPAILCQDPRLKPGSVALYVTLAALSQPGPTNLDWEDPIHNTTCTATNAQIMQTAGYTNHTQMNTYRKQLRTLGALKWAKTKNQTNKYTLVWSQTAEYAQ